MLGGGRVLHKLKEELGGTLEYRRAEGVVLVHGQQSEEGPEKAAACVRTALLLSDGGGGPKVRPPLQRERHRIPTLNSEFCTQASNMGLDDRCAPTKMTDGIQQKLGRLQSRGEQRSRMM